MPHLVRLLAVAVLIPGLMPALGAGPARAAAGLAFPAPAGTTWSIVAGYNTATHLASDPYAIDVVRNDGETSGTTVLAPTDGTLSISTNCLTIRDAARVAVLLCHVLPAPGLKAGVRVARGQVIGSVAPPGAAGNNGLAHIHIATHVSEGGRGFGNTVPLVGAYAVEDVPLPATGDADAYSGVTFRSTNVQTAGVTTSTVPVVAPVPPSTPTPPAATSMGGALLSGFTGTRSLSVVARDATAADLLASMRAAGGQGTCTLSSLVAGRWLSYIEGAPSAVNVPWQQAYPATLAAMTPLFAACS
ncbi:MAG: hypothetical protein IT299_00645 [Dehalococcoidia bacterium]|nr:hypothetical protein [Dehalococcoidia bacterium]